MDGMENFDGLGADSIKDQLTTALRDYWPLILFGGVAGWWLKGKTWQGAALGVTIGGMAAAGASWYKSGGLDFGKGAAAASLPGLSPCQRAAQQINAAMQQRMKLSRLAQLTTAEQRACTAAGGTLQYRKIGMLSQPVGCSCAR